MREAESRCACAKLQRLEGSATTAYISQFLTKVGSAEEATYYECRECHRRWKKVEEANRPSLIQITSSEEESV